MATIRDLEKYLDYEFSDGSYTGNDYKTFQTKYINYLKSICSKNYMQLVNIGRNHYCFSTFIKNNDGKYIYLSISDVRYHRNEWYTRILIRSADSERDYRGGYNLFTNLPCLEQSIKDLFLRS